MKIVIDIPEHIFKNVNMFGWDNEYNDIFEMALENSIVLPKGHGRLIDADTLIKSIEKKSKRLKNLDTINGLCGAVNLIYKAKAIIESDKEGWE